MIKSPIASPIGSPILSGFGLGGGAIAPPAWYTQGKVDGVDPTFWADFANNRYAANGVEYPLTDIITFARSSTGMYFDSTGTLVSAAIGVPRITYDPYTLERLGLMIEHQRTNILTYSKDLTTGWNISQMTKTNGVGTAPDGGAATKITPSNANASHRLEGSASYTNGITYGVSMFVKPDGYTNFGLAAYTGADHAVLYNLSGAGSVVGYRNPNILTAGVVQCAGGWYRVWFTFTAGATGGGAIGLQISSWPDAGSTNWDAMGVGDTVSGHYVWGAQVEAANTVTSYIPTVASTVTRSTDVLTMTSGTAVPFANWNNQAAGTMFADYVFQGNVGGRCWAFILDAGVPTGDRVHLAVGSSIEYAVIVTTNQAAGISTYALAQNTRYKHAAAFAVNDFASSLNGTTIKTDASGSIPSGPTTGRIGAANGSVSPQGIYKDVRFYPFRGSDSELVRIST